MNESHDSHSSNNERREAEISDRLVRGFEGLISDTVPQSSLSNEAVLSLETFKTEISLEMATTVTDVAVKLDVPLEEPLDFEIWELPKGVDAFVFDDKTVVFSLSLLSRASRLMANGKNELAKAHLRRYIAHELKHISDDKRFPSVMQREKNGVRSSPEDMALYHLTRMEQSAELWSIKYLTDLEETDSKQKKANQIVADRARWELSLNLTKSRVQKRAGKLLSKSKL